jgi:alpha-mannosidase II
MIVDQWRKKSVLYKSRSVLIPLGDDFRYTQSMEWEAQRVNFEKLFEYINNEPSFNVEAKFGTLQEYFDSVRHEKSGVAQFPSLSGDFFTYADRDDHYWSGYFTSRPYYKRMDRVLMNYLRTAEMLHSWHQWDASTEFDKRLQDARRALAIFQHHDGVTGTAKDYVMKDYDRMMIEGIKNSKFVIQQAVYRLLTEPNIYHPDYSYTYFNIDDSRSAANDDSSRSVIIIGDEIPFKYVVIHNSQSYTRNEIVEFYIAKPFVCVTDSDGNSVDAQITPAWSWHRNLYSSLQPQASTTKYRLLFTASIGPLGLNGM